MVWRTMAEWNTKGKRVIKGSKCLLRDPDGNCLFNEDQVEKKSYRTDYNNHIRSSYGYYAQSGGNYQKHDYDYDNYDFE